MLHRFKYLNDDSFTENEFNLYDGICVAYAKRRCDGKLYPVTHLNYTTHDTTYINRLYDAYVDAIEKATTIFQYIYVDGNDRLIDIDRRNMSFSWFPLTSEELISQLIDGMYQPLYACTNMIPTYCAVTSGRHRIRSMRAIAEKKLNNIKYLCFLVDKHSSEVNLEVTIPEMLYEQFFKQYGVIMKNITDGFCTILVNSVFVLWAVLKIYEKEFNYLLENHFDVAKRSGILPANIINVRV